MYPPKAHPEAGLGVMVNYLKPFQKKASFFWGYKNHVLSDATSELPLFELTKPANVNQGKLLVPILRRFKELIGVVAQAVIDNAAYTFRVKSQVHPPGVTCKTGYCSQARMEKIPASHPV